MLKLAGKAKSSMIEDHRSSNSTVISVDVTVKRQADPHPAGLDEVSPRSNLPFVCENEQVVSQANIPSRVSRK